MNELIKVTYNNGSPLPEFNNAAQVHVKIWSQVSSSGSYYLVWIFFLLLAKQSSLYPKLRFTFFFSGYSPVPNLTIVNKIYLDH